MLTLVHSPRSRSTGFLWLLEEAGAPYEIQYVSIRRGDGSGAIDPANPHPHGKVPVLKDGSTVVFEQTAIALYVADKFPKARLGRRSETRPAARSSRCSLITRACRAGLHVEAHEHIRSARHRGLG